MKTNPEKNFDEIMKLKFNTLIYHFYIHICELKGKKLTFKEITEISTKTFLESKSGKKPDCHDLIVAEFLKRIS